MGGWFYKKIYTPGGITKYIYLVNERMDERWLCPTSLALGIILIWKSLRSWNIKGTVIYFKGEIIGIKPSNCRNKLWNASQRSEIKYIFLNSEWSVKFQLKKFRVINSTFIVNIQELDPDSVFFQDGSGSTSKWNRSALT